MNEIFTQLIAAAIDSDKIPGLMSYDMSQREKGVFLITLRDRTVIKIKVSTTVPATPQ